MSGASDRAAALAVLDAVKIGQRAEGLKIAWAQVRALLAVASAIDGMAAAYQERTAMENRYIAQEPRLAEPGEGCS